MVLLYQSGYVTIKEYNTDNLTYRLDFPNLEVKSSFLLYLSEVLLTTTSQTLINYPNVYDALVHNDPDQFIKEVAKFFTTVSANPQPCRENAFVIGILALLYMSKDLWVDNETPTQLGKADITVRNRDTVYVIEIKVDKKDGEALSQLKDKKYCDKYIEDHRYDSYSVVGIGINFNSKTREIIDSEVISIRVK